MTSRVEIVEDILQPDRMACQIADIWVVNDTARMPWKNSIEEIRRFLYATDTTQTTNSQLPWKNKTTIPKLCQISDNLYANYDATIFPLSKPVEWQGDNKDSNSIAKRDAIVAYMQWCMDQPHFKKEVRKLIRDYIEFGNAFVTVEWLDLRVELEDRVQAGFIGPAPRRINPNDIVMNPTAETFVRSPKVVRSLVNIGEVKQYLEAMSTDENREQYEQLWQYMRDIRGRATSFEGEWVQNDALYSVDGFGSFREYLRSDYAEILTFYGDMYDIDTDTYLKNHVITVVDRHKLIGKRPNPSFFGHPPIFHSSWRQRQDNLWGMGPLANLVGMQYRLDHVENMKADIYDLTTYPVQKVKGFVEDFTWQPGEKIFVGEEGDVELVTPDVNALQANFELQALQTLMEEMAGAPKEAMGFRTPGEKTKYEIQRMENAASRLFQNKIRQFEEEIVEPMLNGMLELARRNMTSQTTIKVMDEFNEAVFKTLTVEDITGIGRIKPVASRHFAEQAEIIQNLTNLTNSNLWPTVQPHYSGIGLAKITEQAFNLKDFGIVRENIALSEQADSQKHSQALEEDIARQTMTASGIGDDFDIEGMQ